MNKKSWEGLAKQMGKKHDTFPDERPEMPLPKESPEVIRPSDPNVPEIPQEDPQIDPDELPPTVDPEAPRGIINEYIVR